MAYRRKQQVERGDASLAYIHDSIPPPSADSSSSAASLAAKAIKASSAYRESSLSSVYEQSVLSSPRGSAISSAKDPSINENAPKKNMNESKQGFWGTLARKAKSIIDDDNDDTTQPRETPNGTIFEASDDRSKIGQYHSPYDNSESLRKIEGPGILKGLDSIASSLNYIGGTIGKSLEEGITAVENHTASLIQETRKIQMRKNSDSSISQNKNSNFDSLRRLPFQDSHVQPQNHTTLETQLKASRDVAMAMAAKSKLLMRELKTVKADLAFAKGRCAQLEGENRIHRENREKGDNPDDDDLVRLQLESLMAEKARLAQENSVYARENRFLREIVEYHQLRMQDVVCFDEGSEEVSEVYPIKITTPTPTLPHGAFSHLTFDSLPNPYVQMTGKDVK